jgi:hypothetical protein
MEHKKRIEKSIERKIEEGAKKVFKVIFFIILGLAIAFLVGYVVMRLWNWLMPDLFGLPTVGYWQAVGILILAKIIFGFGGGDGPSSSSKKSKSKKWSFSEKCDPPRKDFSEWKHYDAFWKEEGEKAFDNYTKRKENEE